MQQYDYKINDISVYGVKTNQFKTIQFQCQFVNILNKESAPKRALLAYILKVITKDYPTRKLMNLHLQELFASHLRTGVRKVGNSHIITFFVSMINQEYAINDTDILTEMFDTLGSVLYNPLFEETIFNEEKQALIDYLLEIQSDPMRKAMLDLNEALYADDLYGTNTMGTVEDISALTLDDVLDAYHEMISENDIFITWVGNIEKDVMDSHIRNTLRPTKSPKQIPFISTPLSINTPKKLVVPKPVKQTKIITAYASNITYNTPDYYAMVVFNAMFGGHADSLLFNTVRNEHSLCYQIGSSYDQYKGTVFVYTGIDTKNIKRVNTLIKQVLTSIQDNTFSDEDLSLAKKAIETSLSGALDSPYSILNHLTKASLFNQTWNQEELITKFNLVSRDKIVDAANALKEAITYIVKGDQNE